MEQAFLRHCSYIRECRYRTSIASCPSHNPKETPVNCGRTRMRRRAETRGETIIAVSRAA